MKSIIEWHDPTVLLPVPFKEGIDREYLYTEQLLVITELAGVATGTARLIPFHPVYSYRDGRQWFIWNGYFFDNVLLWAFMPDNPLKN